MWRGSASPTIRGMSRIASVLVVVALVVFVNLGLRLIDFPSVDVSLPDIHLPDWLHWVNKAKNVVLVALLVTVVVAGVAKDARKDR
jgi:hypothetical protein